MTQRIRTIAEELDAHRKRAQEQHKLGLTGIYNVLDALRSGRSLDAKEQGIHDAALVSTLKRLHDQLDAAVAEAYGWPWPLTDDEILTRVVELNKQRVREEARGTIRWLRPEFQVPVQQGLPLSVDKKKAKPTPKSPAARKSRAKPVWPKARPEQVEAVSSALTRLGKAVTARELANTFSRADPKVVTEILSALVTLGRAHRGETRGTFLP